MLADKRRQLSDQLGVAAAGQVGFDALLDGGEAGLLEACRLGPGERHVRHFGERPTPPQGQGAPQGHRRDLVAAGGQLAPGVRQKRLEAGGVQVAGSHPQEVAGGPGHHDVVGPATPQRLPEPGEGGEGPVGRLALPEVVNEALGGHDLVGGEEEPSQQDPFSASPDGDRATRTDHLNRAEDQELQPCHPLLVAVPIAGIRPQRRQPGMS